MQYDESKLIFFTGAPGSKWSATAHLMTLSDKFNINTSDYSEERVYTHPNPQISHLGAYFGPGFEFGQDFHRINELTKEEVIEEIDKPYADKNWNQYRLIKCHQFSLNLDWIKENFPLAKIMMVFRPDDACIEGWFKAGGFDIKYPDYNEYYVDRPTMEYKIKEEQYHTRKFIGKNDIDIHMLTFPYWKKNWGIEPTTEELTKYMTSILQRKKRTAEPHWIFDTYIALYNFGELE